MWKTLGIVIFASITLGYCQEPLVPMLDGRIVGGDNASISDYPYQISLQYVSRHRCGGSLISTTWVLSAAHCTIGNFIVQLFTVRAGSSYRNAEGEIVPVRQIINHAAYNPSTIDSDICVIQIAYPFTISNTAVIPMPATVNGPAAGALATITGWGTTSQGGVAADVLQVVQVPIVSQEVCRHAYGASMITDTMFCAGLLEEGGKDACQGDSGGPVIVGGELVGVVSWGRGCARRGFPGVYANVHNLRPWILQITGI